MSDIGALARYFTALGDETRLRLVRLLRQQEVGQAACVGRLAQQLGVTSSSVSQHLRVLKDLGLVQRHRRGYRIHYFLNRERLAAYQELIREQLGDEFAAPEVLPTDTEAQAPYGDPELEPVAACAEASPGRCAGQHIAQRRAVAAKHHRATTETEDE